MASAFWESNNLVDNDIVDSDTQTYASRTASNITKEAPVTRNPHHFTGKFQLIPSAPPDTNMESSAAAASSVTTVIDRQQSDVSVSNCEGSVHSGVRPRQHKVYLNWLRHGESTTSLVSNASSKPSGYNEGFRYQGNKRKKTRPKPVTGTHTVLT
jgi:hypothetical protein